MEHSIEEQFAFSFDFLKKRLEGKKDSFGMLMRDVIKSGICTNCSACVSVCPILVWDEEMHQPKIDPNRGKCTGCGACYNQCPRTITDPELLVGDYIAGYVAKSTDRAEHAQDGGVVSALLNYLLEERLVDGAIVTKKSDTKPWWPEAIIATTKDEVNSAAGSIYCHSQTVEKLVDAIKGGMHSLAFVGTPCNVSAVSKMLTSPQGMLRYFMRANIFKIGIFCMDSFSPEALYSFFEREGIPLDQVEHMNITKGKFYIHYNGEEKAYPIKVLDKYKASSCNFCLDFTAEDADISVGSTGSGPGTNTVLIRSELGRDIFEDAVAKGYLEVQPFEKAGLASVLFLAKLKKVAQYNAKVRNVYIIQQTGATIPPAVPEPDMTVKMGPAEQSGRRRNLISASEKLTEAKDIVKINLSNSAGYVLEHLRVRVAKIEDVFETGVWYQDLPDLYPYEGIELDYPLIGEDGSTNMNDIIVEASDQTGRIFNKKVSIVKLLEPKEPSETKADT